MHAGMRECSQGAACDERRGHAQSAPADRERRGTVEVAGETSVGRRTLFGKDLILSMFGLSGDSGSSIRPDRLKVSFHIPGCYTYSL